MMVERTFPNSDRAYAPPRFVTNPRLVKLLQWQGILSAAEAQSAINAHRRGDGRHGGSEAVVHYGGATKLLHDAIRNRARIIAIYGERRLGHA